MTNGALLHAAEREYDAFITTDNGIPHQQDLRARDLIVVVLDAGSNRYADLAPLIPKVESALLSTAPGELVRIAN